MKLIAADLDGTILNSSLKPSEKTIETLKKVINKGHVFIPATGRTFYTIPKEIRELPGIEYVLYSSGAIVKNLRTGEIIYDRCLSPNSIKEVLGILKDYDYILEVYNDGKAYITEDKLSHITDYESVQEYIDYFKNDVIHISEDKLFEIINSKPIEKMNIRVNLNKYNTRSELIEQLRKIPNLDIVVQVEGNIEVIHKDANKGLGIKALAEYMDINPKNIIALGDSDNDIPMLKYAGIGVSMGQAKDHVKEYADYITSDYNNDGVSKALEKFILNN